MSTLALYPSLSEDAWLTNSQKTADMLMSHFLATNFSQSYLYYGRIASFAYILATNHGNNPSIAQETERVLSEMFSRFFSSVVVETQNQDDPNDGSANILQIFVQVTDNEGQTISIGEMLRVTDSTFSKIVALNNDGTS